MVTAVTPQGTPEPGRDRPWWPLVVAVGVAGVALGYLLGGGPANDPPVASETTTTTFSSEPTVPSRPPPTPPEPALAERVPGFEGTLRVQLNWLQTLHTTGPRLWTWPAARRSALEDRLPVMGIASPDAGGGLFAGFGSSARGPILYVGPPRSMRPALFEVSSFAWHVTDPGRLAWLEFTDEAGRYALMVAEATTNGTAASLSLGVPVAVVDEARVLAWGAWGFLLVRGHGPDFSTFEASLLDASGNERWRHAASDARISTAGDMILVGGSWNLPSFSDLALIPASSPGNGSSHPLEWVPAETLAIAWSPDSTRLALATSVPPEDITFIEIRGIDGELLDSTALTAGFRPPHVPTFSIHRFEDGYFIDEHWSRDITWSPDGRFVIVAIIGPDQRSKVVLYDTIERRLHELDAPMPAYRVVVQAP